MITVCYYFNCNGSDSTRIHNGIRMRLFNHYYANQAKAEDERDTHAQNNMHPGLAWP